MNNILKAQEALYLWLSSFDKRSYDLIRQSCDYLNIQYDLGIESYAVWKIFYPLVYTGVVEHVGNGDYALTEPMAIDFGTHYVIINSKRRELFKKNGKHWHFIIRQKEGDYLPSKCDSVSCITDFEKFSNN